MKHLQKPVQLNSTDLNRWMKILLARADELGKLGEVPVTAIILDSKGRAIGHGNNCRNREKNPLGHAELIALRQAAWVRNDWRFNDCTLIVTLEPCQMCAGALVQARMGQVIYGASDQKRGGLGGAINLAEHKSAHHHMIIKSGVMRKEAKLQLENWFTQRRLLSNESSEVQIQKH